MRLQVNHGAVAAEDDDFLVTRALVTTWKPDFFELLVQEVSQELEHMIAIASPQSQNIYCPFDFSSFAILTPSFHPNLLCIDRVFT